MLNKIINLIMRTLNMTRVKRLKYYLNNLTLKGGSLLAFVKVFATTGEGFLFHIEREQF